MWFPNRSGANRAVQAQKRARSLFSPMQIVGFPTRWLNYACKISYGIEHLTYMYRHSCYAQCPSLFITRLLYMLHSELKSLTLDTWLQTLRAMVHDKISKKVWNCKIYPPVTNILHITFFAKEHFAFEIGCRATKYFILGNIYTIGK